MYVEYKKSVYYTVYGTEHYYDEQAASRLAALGVPYFVCTAQVLPELLERALKKQDLYGFNTKK